MDYTELKQEGHAALNSYGDGYRVALIADDLADALADVERERDAAQMEALELAASIADGFGIIGARATDDDYWGGCNDTSVKIAAAIRGEATK